MRIHRSWILTALLFVGAAASTRLLWAQGVPAAPPTMMAPPYGMGPGSPPPGAAPYMPPAMGMQPGFPPGGFPPGGYPPAGLMGPGAMGGMPPSIQPVAYDGPMAGPAMGPPPGAPFPGVPMQGMPAPLPGAMPSGPMGPPPGACGACGGLGCQMCGPGGGLHGGGLHDDNVRLGHLLKFLLPYGDGGVCAPRWYDIYAEAMFLAREDVSRFQPFTSDGPAGFGPPLVVLSTDDLSFNDYEAGFRVQTAIHLGPGGSLEFGYMGTFNWDSRASVTDENNELFSVISDFGSDPLFGFKDTDASSFQGIEYSSTFDTVELDFRHRWVTPNCRLHGSWLMGVRYFKLDEEFRYLTQNTQDPPDGPGFMNYFVGTSNSMTGFQLGGDLWLSLIPGLRFGGEAKVGLFGNHAEQRTTIAVSELDGLLVEEEASDDVAFISEAQLTVTWRLSQHWTLRGGYHVLFIEGVALAPENFNEAPPFIDGERVPFINDNGNAFYHGFTGGLEWAW